MECRDLLRLLHEQKATAVASAAAQNWVFFVFFDCSIIP